MTLRFQIRDPVQCHSLSLSLSLSSLSAREPVPFLNSAHACTSILADRPRPGIELHTRPSMCARAPVQFNMERKRTRKRPAELGEPGGRSWRRTEAEMQAAPCESLARRSGGVECRWLPYPTGQPVKLRYHLTRTLRPYHDHTSNSSVDRHSNVTSAL